MSERPPRIVKGRLQRLGKLASMATGLGTGLLFRKSKSQTALKIFETLGELKGVAMKAGQSLALYADQLPPEMQSVFKRFFSQAPMLPYVDIARVIESELGDSPSKIFESVEETPTAAASLGQVHRGRLKTGEQVAIKVQYPDIGEALENDLRNAHVVVKALSLGGSVLDTREYFEEIKRELIVELDYRIELQRLESFRAYLKRWPDLKVPKAYPQFSTGKVLVLEWIEGPTLTEYAEGAAMLPAAERFAVAERLIRAIFGPFIFHRAIHADTHPGNYIVCPDGKLAVLDYGSVKHLSEPFWSCEIEALSCQLEQRPFDPVALIRKGGFTVDLPDLKARQLLDEVIKLVSQPLSGFYDFSEDSLIPKMQDLQRRNALDFLKIRPPPEALLFYRAVGGLYQNLRSLKAAGDFQTFFRNALIEINSK